MSFNFEIPVINLDTENGKDEWARIGLMVKNCIRRIYKWNG